MAISVTIALNLGYTLFREVVDLTKLYGEIITHDDLSNVFGQVTRIGLNVQRLSQDCFRIKLEYHGVMSARYEKFDYTDEVCGLIGDTLQLQYQKTLRIIDYDADHNLLIVQITR